MAEVPASDEPRIQPPPSRVERLLNRALHRTAGLLSSLVATILLALAVLALAGVVRTVVVQLSSAHDFGRAADDGLDGTFLVIILLELVHTTLSRGPITMQLQEFLVVGVTAAVRSGLELAAQRTGSHAVDLVLDAVAVLIFVGALWLVRHERAVRGGAPSSAAPGG